MTAHCGSAPKKLSLCRQLLFRKSAIVECGSSVNDAAWIRSFLETWRESAGKERLSTLAGPSTQQDIERFERFFNCWKFKDALLETSTYGLYEAWLLHVRIAHKVAD